MTTDKDSIKMGKNTFDNEDDRLSSRQKKSKFKLHYDDDAFDEDRHKAIRQRKNKAKRTNKNPMKNNFDMNYDA